MVFYRPKRSQTTHPLSKNHTRTTDQDAQTWREYATKINETLNTMNSMITTKDKPISAFKKTKDGFFTSINEEKGPVNVDSTPPPLPGYQTKRLSNPMFNDPFPKVLMDGTAWIQEKRERAKALGWPFEPSHLKVIVGSINAGKSNLAANLCLALSQVYKVISVVAPMARQDPTWMNLKFLADPQCKIEFYSEIPFDKIEEDAERVAERYAEQAIVASRTRHLAPEELNNHMYRLPGNPLYPFVTPGGAHYVRKPIYRTTDVLDFSHRLKMAQPMFAGMALKTVRPMTYFPALLSDRKDMFHEAITPFDLTPTGHVLFNTVSPSENLDKLIRDEQLVKGDNGEYYFAPDKQHTGRLVVCEDPSGYMRLGINDERINRWVFQLRHRWQSLIFCAQRFKLIPRTIRSQMDTVYLFRTGSLEEMKSIEEFFGGLFPNFLETYIAATEPRPDNPHPCLVINLSERKMTLGHVHELVPIKQELEVLPPLATKPLPKMPRAKRTVSSRK